MEADGRGLRRGGLERPIEAYPDPEAPVSRFARPLRSLSRAEVREVDRRAIEELGLPGVVLMENAGLGLTDRVEDELRLRGHAPGAAVGVVCGRGNNGGDGFVLARQLALRGWRPRVAYAGDLAAAPRTGDAGLNLAVLERAGAGPRQVRDALELGALLREWAEDGVALLADGLYGTGLSGPLRADGLALVQALDAAPLPKVAIDIPSGLCCDRGLPLGAAVRCVRTVTFVAPKQGFDAPGAEAWTGRVDVVPIGCPAAAWSFLG